MEKLLFEEIKEEDFLSDASAGCSGSRSDCCTRVCKDNEYLSDEKEWGQFLEVEGGIIQY